MQRWRLVDTINFYRGNFSNFKFQGLLFFFFGFGLPFHCCTFPDFFRQLIGNWLTKIKLVKKLYQFKNNCAGPQTICTMSKIELQNLHFNCCLHMLNHVPFATHDINIFNPHMAGLEKKNMNFSVSFEQAVLTCGLLILVNNFVRGWLAYTLAHWVSEL